jgi:hypothetical protein
MGHTILGRRSAFWSAGRAASEMGSRFRIALVSRVGKADSQIAFLDDPFGLAERGQLSAVPNAWRICGVTGSPKDLELERAKKKIRHIEAHPPGN